MVFNLAELNKRIHFGKFFNFKRIMRHWWVVLVDWIIGSCETVTFMAEFFLGNIFVFFLGLLNLVVILILLIEFTILFPLAEVDNFLEYTIGDGYIITSGCSIADLFPSFFIFGDFEIFSGIGFHNTSIRFDRFAFKAWNHGWIFVSFDCLVGEMRSMLGMFCLDD